MYLAAQRRTDLAGQRRTDLAGQRRTDLAGTDDKHLSPPFLSFQAGEHLLKLEQKQVTVTSSVGPEAVSDFEGVLNVADVCRVPPTKQLTASMF